MSAADFRRGGSGSYREGRKQLNFVSWAIFSTDGAVFIRSCFVLELNMPLGLFRFHGSPLTMRGSWIDMMKWLQDTKILNCIIQRFWLGRKINDSE